MHFHWHYDPIGMALIYIGLALVIFSRYMRRKWPFN